jgi:Homeodomain-like domain
MTTVYPASEGWTYHDLARKWGVDISTVRRWFKKSVTRVRRFAPTKRTVRFSPEFVIEFERANEIVTVQKTVKKKKPGPARPINWDKFTKRDKFPEE